MDVFALAFLFLLKHFDRAVYPQQPIAGCRHINRQNYGWVQQSFPLYNPNSHAGQSNFSWIAA
jgi:hypothetical protein